MGGVEREKIDNGRIEVLGRTKKNIVGGVGVLERVEKNTVGQLWREKR